MRHLADAAPRRSARSTLRTIITWGIGVVLLTITFIAMGVAVFSVTP